MGAALGLVLGVGLLLIWQALTTQPRVRRRRTRISARIESMLRASGISTVTPLGLLSLALLCGLVGGLAVLAVSRTPPVATAFGLMAAYGPIAVVRGRVRRRRRELAEVWPEAVDNLASAVRAGLSLPEALTQLGERGPEPLRPAFAGFGRDYLATGRFADCLNRLKEDLADPVGDRVIEALRIAREVGGGDLGRMLRALSRFLRDDSRTRSELEARQAWVVNGARLAAASPWAVLLALSMQSEVIGRYRSTAGVLVLAIGAAACFVAYRLMVRLGRLPEEKRVLT
ncbi:MAG: type II secretion system F family protein [Propionibacteriales bacterium]|nr:type II secretion system F family protein [Propionibacteriales bacterium]